MKQNIELKGYYGKWSSIDKKEMYDFTTYYLMENNTFGDETFYLVIDNDNNVICETFDDLETSLIDNGII